MVLTPHINSISISRPLYLDSFSVTFTKCLLSLLLLLLLLLFGSVHLSMPRHDYVKSDRLAVTDKTKPIYIYLHI